MKVTKVALLEATNAAITAHEQQVKDYAAAAELWHKQRRQKWLDQKSPQWRDLRDMITAALKAGKPITSGMINKALISTNGRYSYIADHAFNPNAELPNPIVLNDGTRVPAPPSGTGEVYDRYGRKQKTATPTASQKELLALKLFLESSPDEVFSLESLSRLGFKAPASVFRAAVSA